MENVTLTIRHGRLSSVEAGVNWESAWFSGDVALGGHHLMTYGGVVYDGPPNSGKQRILAGDTHLTWLIGRASKELEAEVKVGHSSAYMFGRYDGPFIDLCSSEVKIGDYKKMFLLAPEARQVTVNTLTDLNGGGFISPWYRQYLNLGF